MAKELYVGKLSYDATEEDLKRVFSVSGTVTSVHIITDPHTGQSKGCAYVRMSTEAEAKDAILSLDGAIVMDRTITVSIATPQKHTTAGYKPGSRGAGKRPGGFSRGGSAKPGRK
ncbi:RNA-binding protein [Geomonas sp. RF6]|uniref:RNA recognition motif domain-containing protein n=1 Tax=Geomonas sp. RF6 TaxID=2897342 RepID=UPI001E57EBE0|nr:RNA-binding protein [Geomonas sp. RF6]UFS72284.1 RNA-binding protein [Geomonas sp. RF6]